MEVWDKNRDLLMNGPLTSFEMQKDQVLIKRYRPGLRKGGKSGDVDCFGWDAGW